MQNDRLEVLEILARKQVELSIKQFDIINSLVDQVRALEAVNTALIGGLTYRRREAIRASAGSMFVDLEGAEHIAGIVDSLTRGFAGIDPAEVAPLVQ